MATAYLKDGSIVEVPIESIADFLETNKDLIQPQELTRRGPVRNPEGLSRLNEQVNK